jgi:PAS domain S-box-containing protein
VHELTHAKCATFIGGTRDASQLVMRTRASAVEHTTAPQEEEASEGTEQAVARLRRIDARFRLLVESVKDYAIVMLDPEGNVATWNAGAESINGYSGDEIVGKHFCVFYPPEDVTPGKCERDLDVAAHVGRFEDEGWRLRKDGSRFWASVVITALRDRDGPLLGFAKVTRDLTSQNQMERERMRLAKAEAAERRNVEFLAIMGHELRNPLAPMATAVHLIKLRGGRNCDREIAVLERQIVHMTRLLDDILDASRVWRDKIPMRREVIEMSDAVANAVEIAAPLIEGKRHRLAIDVPATGLPVEVDAGRMTQVFSNLLNNAAKYTDKGGSISIRAAADGDDVVVTIADNGVGIAPDLLPRVFDLFTQAEQGLERQLGGLGIGLAIAQRLVVEHGGRLTAESDGLGAGSRFHVRLPRAIRPQPTSDSQKLPVHVDHRAPSRRVLVVDDNTDATEMMRYCLEALGHEVSVAHEGDAAIAAAEAFVPDLIFLDVGLPGQSGYEVVKHLREMPSCARVPVVAVTGYASDADRVRAREAGFTSHLAKPIDVSRLGSIVTELTGAGDAATL